MTCPVASLSYRRGNTWSLAISPNPGETPISLAGRRLRLVLLRDLEDTAFALDYTHTFEDTPETRAGKGVFAVPSTLTGIEPRTYYIELRDESTDIPPVITTVYPQLNQDYAVIQVLPSLVPPP